MTAKALEQRLGHSFSSADLLRLALTHRSHSSPHNERLEFIGDSVLNCVVAKLLYDRFPALPEGDLSRLRANLVRQNSLHELALGLSLGQHVRLGDGELKSGGANRPSILADTLEALFGAIWLDAGFDVAAQVIAALYGKAIDAINPELAIKDAKTRLQEYLQARRLALPRYSLVATEGDAHAQHFRIACDIDSLRIRTEGGGGSRRAAEQMAAQSALERLQES